MTPKTLSLSLVLSTLLAFPAAATVDLAVSFGSLRPPVLPGTHMTFFGDVYRAGGTSAGTDATEATLTIPLAAGTTNITAVGDMWNCSVQSTTIVCSTSIPATLNSTALKLDFDTPSSPDGGNFRAPVILTTSVPNTFQGPQTQLDIVVYRILKVTTADDFGAGSLRDMIVRANNECGPFPCMITFAGPMKIEPQSPLPAITACSLTIDGGVNAPLDVERPVEISGTKAGFANGLEIRSYCGVTLNGLTINGFAANGVVLAAPKAPADSGEAPLVVQGCFIGTDTKAEEARPNGMRGISVESPFTQALLYSNTVSGNHYSGIAVWQAASVSIGGRIGAGKDLRPLGNGASGVLIDGGQAWVSGVIANNHDFGVAIGPHAQHADVDADGFSANGILDIDWGLDGPSRSDPFNRMPSVPVLIDTSYDPVHNSTVVKGVLPAEGRNPNFVTQQYAVRLFDVTPHGYVSLWPQANFTLSRGDTPFTMSVGGDLRGHTIVAQTFLYAFTDELPLDSSELSTTFPVHP